MNRIFNALMGWTVVTTAVLWLIFVRALLVPARPWSLFGLDGKGLGGDLWVVALLAGFSALLLTLGWRGKQAPFHLMLLLWHITIASVAVTVAIRQIIEGPGRASTPLLSVGALATALVVFAVLAVVWVALDLNRTRSGRHNSVVRPLFQLPIQELTIAAGLLPIAFLLYRVTGNSSLGNSVANLALILQWVLLAGVVLRGKEPRPHGESTRHPLDVSEPAISTSTRFRSR